jgi:hypothetical protein
MAVQFDVKSAEKTSSGAVFAGPARLKALTIAYASGGTVAIKDGGSGGTTVWSFTAPAAAGSVHVILPGDGILCGTSMYATLSSATVSVVYG